MPFLISVMLAEISPNTLSRLFFLIFTYLAVLGLSCCTQGVCYRIRDLSLWYTDSLVVELRISSCPAACGILVPSPLAPTTPALQGRFLTTRPTGKVHVTIIFNAGCRYQCHDPLNGSWASHKWASASRSYIADRTPTRPLETTVVALHGPPCRLVFHSVWLWTKTLFLLSGAQ